jgi:SAM-dependent methyltransferase
MVQPPGSILQQIYLRERLIGRRPGKFLEVGCGSGWISRIFLELGWSGLGVDLHEPSIRHALEVNRPFVDRGSYRASQLDFLDPDAALGGREFDVIISCMVIEHLDDAGEARYFDRCRELIAEGGLAILLVPASEEHWGIEDEIAGHFRRYTHASLTSRLDRHGWDVPHISGLTYPVSNLLLGISNYLVRRAERAKLDLPLAERTRLSGDRDVFLKTKIPRFAKLVLNEWTMTPWHRLQKRFGGYPACMVLYAECAPQRATER